MSTGENTFIEVVCPLDGMVHYGGLEHLGKTLRCAKCGRPVLIGGSGVSAGGQIVGGSRPTWSRTHDLTSTGFSSRALLSFTNRRRVLIALCYGVLITLGIGLSRSRRAEPTEQEADSKSISVSEDAKEPKGTGAPADAPKDNPADIFDDVSLPRSLPNGTAISQDVLSDGTGVLRIDNSGGSDAEVKVKAAGGLRTIHDVFVEHGDRWECRDLGAGIYTVLFATGSDWDASAKHFTRNQGYFAFGKSLFYGKPQQDRSSGYEITLYDRPDGTVQRDLIGEAAFNGK